MPTKPPAKKVPAKKIAKKAAPDPVEEQEVTGPSSDPVSPVLTLSSSTTTAGLRVGGYTVTSGFILSGLDQFNIWHGTTGQVTWAMGALTLGLTVLTNFLEAHKGRRLIGTTN